MSVVEKLKSLGAKRSSYSDEQKKLALSILELQVGPLPAEYKAALLYFGGDVEFECSIIFSPLIRNPWSDEDGFNRLGYLYGLHSQYGSSSLIEKREIYDGRVPSDLLVVGEAPGGNQICLGLNGSAQDKVFFWDHEGEIKARAANSNSTNLYLISESFADFVASLGKGESGGADIEGVVVDLEF